MVANILKDCSIFSCKGQGFLEEFLPELLASEGIFTHLKIEKLKKIPVILDVTLCHCARAFYLDCLALKVKAIWSFETA
jgi:hypothetical protein